MGEVAESGTGVSSLAAPMAQKLAVDVAFLAETPHDECELISDAVRSIWDSVEDEWEGKELSHKVDEMDTLPAFVSVMSAASWTVESSLQQHEIVSQTARLLDDELRAEFVSWGEREVESYTVDDRVGEPVAVGPVSDVVWREKDDMLKIYRDGLSFVRHLRNVQSAAGFVSPPVEPLIEKGVHEMGVAESDETVVVGETGREDEDVVIELAQKIAGDIPESVASGRSRRSVAGVATYLAGILVKPEPFVYGKPGLFRQTDICEQFNISDPTIREGANEIGVGVAAEYLDGRLPDMDETVAELESRGFTLQPQLSVVEQSITAADDDETVGLALLLWGGKDDD